MKTSIFSITGMALAAGLVTSASAQPTVFTDLGTHNTAVETVTHDVTLTSSTDIQWFKIVLPAAPAASSGYVDIWTVNGGVNPMTDTEIGVYDNAGNLISNNDDRGGGLFSSLTFGSGSGQTLSGTFIGTGADGPLGGGIYWVAVGRFNVTYVGGWGATSTYTGTQTTTTLNFAVAPATAPFPPNVGTVAMNPNPVDSGAAVLITAPVSPGGNPVSTNITVTVDLSAVAGPSNQAMYDDGTHGDVAAGDGTYSYSYTVPTSALGGANTITVNASDAQSRTGSRTGTLNVVTPIQWDEAANVSGGDAGEVPSTATSPSGSGPLTSIGGTLNASDADMYRIQICEPGNFSASTANIQTTMDTQMFLFDDNGTAIVMNDDWVGGTSLQSAITNAFTASLAPGNYLLAISQYNKDPQNNSGSYIWENTPFRAERGPDGISSGGDNVITAWDAAGGAGGAYRIDLRGACFAGATSNCAADLDNGSGTGTVDGAVTIEDLLYFLVQFEAGSSHADLDNGTFTGTLDGAVTVEDLLFFLSHFEQGC